MERSAVIAIGGNALILDGQRGTIEEQFENARETARHVGALVSAGWRVVLVHGNGPQVGFILLRSELIGDSAPLPRLSLDMSVADSQGGMGHIIANTLLNELSARGMPDRVAYVLTHTLVDPLDKAFAQPSKPIGPFFSEEEASQKQERNGWVMVEDSGRGHRRVVPSPRPVRIVESAAVRTLVEAGFVVIAAGGGGIPVVEDAPGAYRGVEAVIDKDLASALLAASMGVPTLIIATGVEKVALHFRRPDQRLLDRITVSEAQRYLEAGEFPPGSMGPKIRAAIEFLQRGGREVIITSPVCMEAAVEGRSGTWIVPDAAPEGVLRPVDVGGLSRPGVDLVGANGQDEGEGAMLGVRRLRRESERGAENTMFTVEAEPYEFEFDPDTTALLIIDMQRDFVDPGGFGEALGNDVSLLRKAVPPTQRVLEAARDAGMFVIHTREGHRPDLSDLPAAKKARGKLETTIGDEGPMGRILVRGEYGHDIIDELKPRPGEPVVDKPGKGAFYATDLDTILKNRGIKQLVVCGVTTEVCVHTTVREANDRGYDALVLEDCVGSYFPEFQEVGIKMIKAQGGIFGWVSDSSRFLMALSKARRGREQWVA